MTATTRDRDTNAGLVLAGWLMAFLFPPGGIAAGLILSKRRPDQAAGILAVSLLWIIAAVVAVLYVVDPFA